MLHISLRGFSFVPKFARVFPERALHQLIARVWQGAGDCTKFSWVSAASAEMGPQSRYLLAIDGASGRVCGCKWDGASLYGPKCVLTRGFSAVGRLVEWLLGHDIPQVSSDCTRKRRSWQGAAPQSVQTAAGFALCQRQQRTTARGH